MSKKLAAKDLLWKSCKELVKLRNALRKELFDLKIKNSIRALNQTHLIRVARRNIARVNQVLTKKINS